MEVGQKVLYKEETYVMASSKDGVCDIITEDCFAIYNMAGVDIRGGMLYTYDAPDGSIAIIDTEGRAVGYRDVSESDLVAIEGKVAVYDDSKYDSAIFA